MKEFPINADGHDDSMVSGNIKVLVPLSRELLTPEPLPGNTLQLKYRRGKIEKLYEKRVFGVLTKY